MTSRQPRPIEGGTMPELEWGNALNMVFASATTGWPATRR